VRERFLKLLAGFQDDFEALHDRLLANDLAQEARPQRRVALAVIVAGGISSLDDRLTSHVR
jgi:hypothetical protein